MLQKFKYLFSADSQVYIPELHVEYCSDNVIVMEFLDGFRPIPEYRAEYDFACNAIEAGLRALYRMIFEAGLVHCDLHPSNILCRDDGTIALIDFGFVAELSERQRKEFAEFFLSIAFRDGKNAARIVRETALGLPEELDHIQLEEDMQALLDKTAGRRASDFQVAGFVFELFRIQRKHGIYGTPHFTLPILSLLTYEGMIKDIHPQLDFQKEAIPFVMSSMPVTSKLRESKSEIVRSDAKIDQSQYAR